VLYVCCAPTNCIRKCCSTLCYPFHKAALAINHTYHSLIRKISIATYIFPISKELPVTGFVGEKLYANNIRILFVNGMGYTKKASIQATEKISEIFDSSRVDYCCVPLCYTQVMQAIVFDILPSLKGGDS